MSETDAIFGVLGQFIAAGGGGAIVAYGLFRFLGKGWIENQFAKDLELAKSQILLISSRKMKLHDREYIVFPEVWSKLNRAFSTLGNAVIAFREFSDLNRMSDEELGTWIERSDLDSDELSYLNKEKDKNRAYGRILDWRSLKEARHEFTEFYECFQDNRIFLSPDVKEKLEKVAILMNSAWVAKKMDWEGHKLDDKKSFMMEAFEKYEKEAKPIMKEIEFLVQSKLFPNTD